MTYFSIKSLFFSLIDFPEVNEFWLKEKKIQLKQNQKIFHLLLKKETKEKKS